MDFQPVTRSDKGATAHLCLNRPQQGNSLSLATIDALHTELTQLSKETSIAVIVLSGIGKRIFCAGHDLREFDGGKSADEIHTIAARCSAMMQAIHDQPQIVIAKVDGVASAAGCQLVAAADLALASNEARFATPGVNIGLWCTTPMVALSRTINRKHAFHMLATGRLFDANYALTVGLVNAVVSPENLDATVDELADEISSKSSYTLALGKRGFYHQLEMDLSDAYEYAGEILVRNMAHPDAKEGIGAFLDKRAPQWRGR